MRIWFLSIVKMAVIPTVTMSARIILTFFPYSAALLFHFLCIAYVVEKNVSVDSVQMQRVIADCLFTVRRKHIV